MRPTRSMVMRQNQIVDIMVQNKYLSEGIDNSRNILSNLQTELQANKKEINKLETEQSRYLHAMIWAEEHSIIPKPIWSEGNTEHGRQWGENKCWISDGLIFGQIYCLRPTSRSYKIEAYMSPEEKLPGGNDWLHCATVFSKGTKILNKIPSLIEEAKVVLETAMLKQHNENPWTNFTGIYADKNAVDVLEVFDISYTYYNKFLAIEIVYKGSSYSLYNSRESYRYYNIPDLLCSKNINNFDGGIKGFYTTYTDEVKRSLIEWFLDNEKTY